MRYKKYIKSLLVCFLIVCTTCIFAAGGDSVGIAGIGKQLTNTFDVLGQILLGGAYIGGFALVVVALYKFKQHKDNPQQVPMGTPITLLLIGAALIFVPNIIKPAGESIFGGDAKVGGTGGQGFDTGGNTA